MYPILQGYHPKLTWHVGEEGYSCISITTYPCINTSYVMWLCLVVCLLVVWVVKWLFVCFCFKCFYVVIFLSIFYCFYVKNQKRIKSRKSKKFDRHCWVLSQNIFFLIPLYKWLCASMSIACFLCTHIIVGEILKSMWLL